jgi:hypothetical protein
MARLYSSKNWTDTIVNGILLGPPLFMNSDDEFVDNEEDAVKYMWDDHRIPNGWIDDEGNVYVEQEDIEESI